VKNRKLTVLLICSCLILVIIAMQSMTACSKPAPEENGTSAAAPAPTPAPDTTIELSLTHLFPSVSWFDTDFVQPWIKQIEERSNGRVKIIDYPASGLAKPGFVYDAVLNSIVDIGIDPGAYTASRFPLSVDGCMLPMSGGKSSWVYSRVWTELAQEFPAVAQEYSDVHLLWIVCQGPSQVMCKEPVTKAEDLKGKIIRAPGVSSQMIELLGGSPADMPSSDCYMALEKNTIDGTVFPMEAVSSYKLYEVLSNYTIVNFFSAPQWVAMNKNKWDSLPADIQEVFNECSGAAGADIAGTAWKNADIKGLDIAKEKGQNIINLSEAEEARWEELCRPIVDKWISEKEAMGLPAEKLYDEIGRLMQKYNAMDK
jgi:TRAP-type C4-dicarboxylate transport system substrate-binding protein